MSKGDEDWGEDEINVCVDQYAEILRRGGAKRAMPKDLFLARAEKALPKRNSGSVARRMANISHVVAECGLEPVIGWKALENVGPTNTARIKNRLLELRLLEV